MRVIDGDQQRPAVREVDGQPVQPVQHRKRRIERRRLHELSQQQRPHRASRAGQQRVALALISARQTPLEQLAHHAEREARLKLRATRAQDLVAAAQPHAARRLQQRRLANPRPALDYEDHTATLQQLIHRRQLALAFKQLLHSNTLCRKRCAGYP